jgi:hypothetical protein
MTTLLTVVPERNIAGAVPTAPIARRLAIRLLGSGDRVRVLVPALEAHDWPEAVEVVNRPGIVGGSKPAVAECGQPENFAKLSHGQPFCRHPTSSGLESRRKGAAQGFDRPASLAPETVVSFNRNGWSTSAETGGQLPPKWVVRMNRNGWSTSTEMSGQLRPKSARRRLTLKLRR